MMRKLGILMSLVLLCGMMLCWTGCSKGATGYNDCCPTAYYECPEPCDPCPKPCNPCNPCEDPCNTGSDRNVSKITCDGVMVTASQPKLCILGDNYAMDLCIKACVDVCHVEVHAMMPEGVSLVRSEPAGAEQTENMIAWVFDDMKAGEVKHSRVLLRADREGDLCICFCVTAVPVQFCKVLCARPVLECCKCGPEEVCPGDPVHYTITVTNRGSCTAEDVVVVDSVPEELEHSSGQRRLTFKLGDIRRCETKKINVCFTACKRGEACNTIHVTSCNAHPTSCQFCTRICKECVELTKTGPKERKIGETADYQITVTNPGDKPLTQVILCDQAPSATSIVEAPGAEVCGNQAVWRFDTLQPGEKQTVRLTLTTCTPGYYVNRVSVDNCQRCRDCAEAGTRWKGTPALNACFGDTEDPICVGDFNIYTLRVTNQGSEEDSNMKVVLRFPAELVPVDASGDSMGTISGQTVTFAPVKFVGPRQTLEFRVDAQAKDAGDARIKAEVSSDYFRNPIRLEESTIVN